MPLRAEYAILDTEGRWTMTPGITDDGIKHLVALRRLHSLVLGNTKVTDEGVARLRAVFPGVIIRQ